MHHSKKMIESYSHKRKFLIHRIVSHNEISPIFRNNNTRREKPKQTKIQVISKIDFILLKEYIFVHQF